MINPGRQQIRRTINILFALRGHNIIGRTTTQLSKTLSAIGYDGSFERNAKYIY